MRFKLITVLAALAALAVGVTASNAGLHSSTTVKIKIAKAKAPASVVMNIDNTHTNAAGVGIVPERINQVVITSKAAKWYSKGAVQCKVVIPSAAAGNNDGSDIGKNCPSKSKIGSGTFIANAGTPGTVYDPGDAGRITGVMKVYNYKAPAGAQAALLLDAESKTPVPGVHQYILAVVKGGKLTASVPNMADLPTNLSNLFKNPDGVTYKTLSMATMNTSLKSPSAKRPLLTLNNFKSMDFAVELNRD